MPGQDHGHGHGQYIRNTIEITCVGISKNHWLSVQQMKIKCAVCPKFINLSSRTKGKSMKYCSHECAVRGTQTVTFAALKKSAPTSLAAEASSGDPALSLLKRKSARARIVRYHNNLTAAGIPNMIIATHTSDKGSSTLYSDDGSDAANLFRFLHAFASSGSTVGQSLLSIAIESASDPDQRVGQGFLLSLADSVTLKKVTSTTRDIRVATTNESDVEDAADIGDDAATDDEDQCSGSIDEYASVGVSDETQNHERDKRRNPADKADQIAPSEPRCSGAATANNCGKTIDAEGSDNCEREIRGARCDVSEEASAGKRKRTRGQPNATVHAMPGTANASTTRTSTDDILYLGIHNITGVMCWLIALAQSLASSFWVVQAIRLTNPEPWMVRPKAGDALVEVIQRCCNNRSVRPLDTPDTFQFPTSQRSSGTLAKHVLSGQMEHDPSEAILRASMHPGLSGISTVFDNIMTEDVTCWLVPHKETCRDARGRSNFRPAMKQDCASGIRHPPIFIVSPSAVAGVKKSSASTAVDGLGYASYFLDADGPTASNNPGLLARYLTATLLMSDVEDDCSRCSAHLRLMTRRRLLSLPSVIVAYIQKNARGTDIECPHNLYLHNWGPRDIESMHTPASPGVYELVSVIHYTDAPRHYTAHVRVKTGDSERWLRCDDSSVTGTQGPGDISTAVGFVFDKTMPKSAATQSVRRFSVP
jgi:hypothetical protein